MTDRINVAVVDSHPLFRQGLANAVLGSRLVVVAEGATADEARRAAQKSKPDILLLDIGVPGDGAGAAADILRSRTSVKVVILTASDSENDVSDMLRIGVHGYILKDVNGPDLISALEAIHRGEPYITPALASRMLMRNRRKPRQAQPIKNGKDPGLTPRDRRILGHLAKGMTNQEIARDLGVNIRTVKHYLTQVFRRMSVRNRVEAILEAQRIGLDFDRTG